MTNAAAGADPGLANVESQFGPSGVATDITVNKDNVLAAARVIDGTVERLQAALQSMAAELRITPPGGDPVSTDLATAWNDRLFADPESDLARMVDYVANLQSLVQNLAATAQQYGYTESRIADELAKVDAQQGDGPAHAIG
ncbi:MAG: PE domain-containing protein [Sciscionella sp.]